MNSVSFECFENINLIFPKNKITSLIGDNQSGKKDLLDKKW